MLSFQLVVERSSDSIYLVYLGSRKKLSKGREDWTWGACEEAWWSSTWAHRGGFLPGPWRPGLWSCLCWSWCTDLPPSKLTFLDVSFCIYRCWGILLVSHCQTALKSPSGCHRCPLELLGKEGEPSLIQANLNSCALHHMHHLHLESGLDKVWKLVG